MPYLYEKSEGNEAKEKASDQPPFGPGFDERIVKSAARLEMWVSSFSDPGEDWCEYRAFDKEGKPLGTRRIAGY